MNTTPIDLMARELRLCALSLEGWAESAVPPTPKELLARAESVRETIAAAMRAIKEEAVQA